MERELWETPSQHVARRVRELRTRHGLSARELAERLDDLGFPQIDRSVIANLENGRRKSVSVDELLAFAAALKVAPVHLLVPVDNDTFLRVGRASVIPEHAREWVRGSRPRRRDDSRIYYTEVPDNEWQLHTPPPADALRTALVDMGFAGAQVDAALEGVDLTDPNAVRDVVLPRLNRAAAKQQEVVD
jgi:transcriptional regulator with XRE-family HTH domain